MPTPTFTDESLAAARANNFELTARTEVGKAFIRLAETHAATFRERAERFDRENTFPFENFADLRESKFMAAAVPERYGGLGLSSVHDLMVGMTRLARGDASTAIAANMHVAGAMVIARMRSRAAASGDAAFASTIDGLLEQLGACKTVMCFPTTEAGTDIASPMTEATPVEGGYLLNGRKLFATLSPAAQMFFPSVRVPGPEGGYLLGTAIVQRTAPGLRVVDNWDAMGMRASGSNDVVFENCFVAKDRVVGVRDNYGKIGRGFTDFGLTGNLPLIATFLGIAEAAQETAIKTITSQRKGISKKLLAERIPIQQLVAENEIDLSVCRAMIDRLGDISDAFLLRYAETDAPLQESNALLKEVQCMKYVVNRKSIDVVDRALVITGGAAYMTKHPLSRLYRDVRAGPFMQPFPPYEALEYIGKVALGFEPILDR